MPDHIPDFDAFLNPAEGMSKLPASEIRRRGDRRRTIRHTSIAAGTLAFALVAGVAIANSPLMPTSPKLPGVAQPADPSSTPTPSESPSTDSEESPTPSSQEPEESPSTTSRPSPSSRPGPSSPPRSEHQEEAPSERPAEQDAVQPSQAPSPEEPVVTDAPSEEAPTTSAPAEAPVVDPELPLTPEPEETAEETEPAEQALEDSFPDASVFGTGLAAITTQQGVPETSASPCLTGQFGDYEDTWHTVYARPNTDDPSHVTEQVFSYATPEDAQAAFLQLQGQAAMCTDPNGEPLDMVDDGQSEIGASIDLEQLGTDDMALSYMEGSWALEEPEGEGVFLTHMVVRVDNRLAVVIEHMQNTEKHCTPTTDGIVGQCPVPAAAPDVANALQG